MPSPISKVMSCVTMTPSLSTTSTGLLSRVFAGAVLGGSGFLGCRDGKSGATIFAAARSFSTNACIAACSWGRFICASTSSFVGAFSGARAEMRMCDACTFSGSAGFSISTLYSSPFTVTVTLQSSISPMATSYFVPLIVYLYSFIFTVIRDVLSSTGHNRSTAWDARQS